MQGEYGSPPGAPEPRGGRAAARRFNPWVVMLVLSLGMFMTLLDLTIVNIAIPRIVDGVHASLDEVLWMLNAYSLGYAVLLITSGRLGDIVGPRRLFMGGIALFTAASALSGLAPTAGVLIVGRALQGVGAALLAPQSMAILLAIFPAERRGPVFGVFGMLSGLAVVGRAHAGRPAGHRPQLALDLLRQPPHRRGRAAGGRAAWCPTSVPGAATGSTSPAWPWSPPRSSASSTGSSRGSATTGERSPAPSASRWSSPPGWCCWAPSSCTRRDGRAANRCSPSPSSGTATSR